MTDQAGTFEVAVLDLSRGLGQASSRLGDERVLDTFAELGVAFPDQLLAQPAFTAARGAITTAGDRLGGQVAELESAIATGDSVQIADKGSVLAVTLVQLIAGFEALPAALQSAAPALPGITPQQVNDFVANLPRRLLDLLLYDMLDVVPPVGAVAEVLGLVERVHQPGDPANPTKPDHEEITVHLDRLVPALTNPAAHLKSMYHWGEPGFDAAKLLTALDGALGRLGFPVLLRPAAGPDPVTLEAFAVDLRPTASGPPGLEFDLVLPASIDRTFQFPVSPPNWVASVTAKAAVAARAKGTLRPPFDVDLEPPKAGATVSAGVAVDLTAKPPTPLVVIGQSGGSRLEVASVTIGAGVDVTFDTATGKAKGNPTAKGEVAGGKLVIDASQGDGFITTLLSGVHVEADFGLQFAFSGDTGVRFEGSGGLDIQVPLHLSLGPVSLNALYLSAGLKDGEVPIELSAALGAELGPLSASVDRLGAIATLAFPPGGGNAGPAQIEIAFKPPTGAGLAIDAGVVTGGGFLSIDPDRGEYAGILQLEIAGFLGVTAIGLISTKNPDGTPGFSLLVIITADFGPGIQLGYGFTLNAVGGLLGLNRQMLFQPLMDGVRSGAIEGVMFPRDPVANAPQIISDLRAIFPPHEGTFLIGPMAKLGWGEPTIVSVSLGVIIEIPPADIALLGILELVLPADELAILKLQVNFAGALEFSKQRLYFFASLYDSHLLFITLQGEMGLLVAYGDDANFVVSVGGFHPQFNPPPLPFPTPRRIEVDVINESFARIRCDGYFAVTTNTVQFGAHSEMFFGFSALSVEGHSSFDALIQISPFHFTVHISTSFSVKVFGVGVFGVDIDLAVDGPTPWHAKGSASISLLFFDIDVDVDLTFGDARDTTLPPVAVMPLLTGELAKRTNWKAQLPAGSNLLVSLRKLDEAKAELVLHPVGTLQVSQRTVPLDLALDRFGSQKVTDAKRFSVDVGSAGLAKRRELQEPFASGQFKDLDDAARLSQAAYSPQDSGIELGTAGEAYDSGTALTRVVRYDLTIVDTALRPKPRKIRFFPYPLGLFAHQLGGASVALSVLSSHHERLVNPTDGEVAVNPERFGVALQSDNSLMAGDGAMFTSQAAAQDHLDALVAAEPGLAGTLHVLPEFEMAG